jgi:GDPmannose 4,6-dehydratase
LDKKDKMKKALITGITGQDGRYLAQYLYSIGYEVYGMMHGQNNVKQKWIQDNAPYVKILEGDVMDLFSIIKCFEASNPDEVYNLGAMSYVDLSWNEPYMFSQVTGVGVLNMLQAIRVFDKENKIKFYQASSSEMFGKVQETPQKETTRLYPRSPYGAAKAYGHHITINYRESYNMFACTGILFNHESPLRGEEFVTKKITKAVARIKLGKQQKLILGNLDSKRDWGYAGDYVEAMHLMLQHEKPDDYVISTGETHTVREFCQIAFNKAGIKNWEDYVISDPNLRRLAEVDLLVGDSTKAKVQLGWEPKVSFDQLIDMMVEYDLREESMNKNE